MRVTAVLVVLLMFGPVSHSVAVERRTGLTVYDMVCASCAVAVDKALKGLPGIRGVTVERTRNLVVILYDDKRVSTDQMIQALRRAGYRAELRKRQVPPSEE